MRFGLFGAGMFLGVVSTILMLVFYPLVMVDSPEEAREKVREDVVAQGIPLRFKGRIRDVIGRDLLTQKPAITIEGFQGSLGYIRVIVATVEGLAVGDEVLVNGKFYGILGIGYVMGDWDDETKTSEPAGVEGVPTPPFFLALIGFITGLALIIYGCKEA